MIRSTPLRMLAWFALFLVTLYCGYLVTANALLNSDWARSQLDRGPRFTLGWERAWTLFPGHLRITQLSLTGTTAKHRYALTADSATLRLGLVSLREREVDLQGLDAEGIRHLQLGDYRLKGSGTLRLADAHWRSGELAIDALALELHDAVVLHGDVPLVERVALNADLRLDPLSLADHSGNAVARFVSGTLDLAGRSDAYDVFNPYLAALEWLEIGGHGDLQAKLAIASGELTPGSRLHLDSPRLNVRLDERHWLEDGALYQIRGAGAVTVTIEEVARLALALDDIEMVEETSGAVSRPLLRGEGFQLALTAPELRLYSLPDARHDARAYQAELHWQSAEAADIAVFNRYLPAPAPLTLEGGSARLQGGLSYVDEQLSGSFELSGETIALRLGEQPLSGRLDLDLPIAKLDVERGILDISGTHLHLEAATPGEASPLITALALPTARFHSLLAWRELDNVALFDGEVPWTAALELHGHVANLAMLNPFLAELSGERSLALEGGGQLAGALHIQEGQPLAGSRLEVSSEALGARFLGFHARGNGQARLALRPQAAYPEASLELVFKRVDLTRLLDHRRLFQAEHLSLVATTEARPQPSRSPSARVEWRGARIPDVNVLNAYLPETAPLRFQGGQASSGGWLALDEARGQGRITLTADAVSARLLEETFHGSLDAAMELRELDADRQRLDLSGSRVELTASANGEEPLRTLLVARQANLQGGFVWPGSEAPPRPLAGTLQLDGLLDQLGFLNAFLPDEHGLTIQGGGRLSADLRFASGEAMPGSQLRVDSNRLVARFLHYEAFGDGSLILETANPGAALYLSLPRFGLRRQGGAGALIEGRVLEIHSRARHFSLAEGLRTLSTRIDMPHVAVPSLAALNGYLPEDSGIELLSGQARLATHLQLEGMSANGDLLLHAPHARLAFDEQILDGELRLATRLAEGDLATQRFDVSGSQLSMENVRLADDTGNLTHGWWARLTLPEGQMRWEEPLKLDGRLELAMRDSGLLVNLFIDAARERRWLRERLTLGEVRGEARIMLGDDTIRLENLAVRGGSRLELLANLALRQSQLTGRAYVRYGPLQLGIEAQEGQRRWQLRNARAWYLSGQPASEITLPPQREWIDLLDVQID